MLLCNVILGQYCCLQMLRLHSGKARIQVFLVNSCPMQFQLCSLCCYYIQQQNVYGLQVITTSSWYHSLFLNTVLDNTFLVTYVYLDCRNLLFVRHSLNCHILHGDDHHWTYSYTTICQSYSATDPVSWSQYHQGLNIVFMRVTNMDVINSVILLNSFGIYLMEMITSSL